MTDTEALLRQHFHDAAGRLPTSDVPLPALLQGGRLRRRRHRMRGALATGGVLLTAAAVAIGVIGIGSESQADPGFAGRLRPASHVTDLSDYSKPIVRSAHRDVVFASSPITSITIGPARQGASVLVCWDGILASTEPNCPDVDRVGARQLGAPLTYVPAKGEAAPADPSRPVTITGTAGQQIVRVVVTDAHGHRYDAETYAQDLGLGVGYYASRLPAAAGTGPLVVAGYDSHGSVISTATWFPFSDLVQTETPDKPVFVQAHTITLAPGWTITTGLEPPKGFSPPDPGHPICLAENDSRNGGGAGCEAAPTSRTDFGPDTPHVEESSDSNRPGSVTTTYGLVGSDVATVTATADGNRSGAATTQAAGPVCSCRVYGIHLADHVTQLVLRAYDAAGHLTSTWTLDNNPGLLKTKP